MRGIRTDFPWSDDRSTSGYAVRRIREGGALFLLAVFLSGCAVEQTAETASSPPAPAAAPHSIAAAGLEFNPPIRWIPEMPDSSMRLAQYRVPSPADGSADAQLLIYYFEGQGGSAQANIDRWVAQFSTADGRPIEDARITHREGNGLQLALVDVTGTYHESQGPMMGGETTPHPGYRMLAVIVEGPGGPWFVKLTGPEATVEASLAEFDAFLGALDLTTQ